MLLARALVKTSTSTPVGAALPAIVAASTSRYYATKQSTRPPRKGPRVATPLSPAEPSPSKLGDDAPPPADAPASATIPSTPSPESVSSSSATASETPAAAAPEQPKDALTAAPSLAQHFLDIDIPPPHETFGERTGAKAKGHGSKSSIEKKRAQLMSTGMLFGLIGVGAGAYYLSREWDDELEKMKITGRTEDVKAVEESEQGGYVAAWARAKLRTADILDYLNKPAWDPLLPPPLPEPHFRPYTLVIDLDDLLVHSSWDLEHGYRTAKRPGVDYFLAYLSQFYEIVLFTTQPAYTAIPIIEKIDPYGAYLPYKLFREATRYKNNTIIKDLSYLGRPLERTIVLDTNPEHIQLQPTNGILMKPWHGKASDAKTTKELVGLIPFLEALAIRNVKDVRPVIKYYEGKDIPVEYAKAELRLKDELKKKWELERESEKGWGGWLKAGLGGLVKSGSREAPPETDVEKTRKMAQRLYLEEQKYWKDNEELIKKQMEEDRERQLKEMRGSLLGFMGLAPPAPKPEETK
ncbi:hypothetical protein MNV49_000552 [Pseudohyphozyma bogoriensis]|nr:hypothetical protein MNV49_000552 [Pseudohyphozyma bogoriensis]